MPLTTSSELQAAVAAWLARDDLAATIPDFVSLFEAVANRRLRVREMEATAALATAAGEAALPADYLAWKRLTWLGARPVQLDYAHPDYLRAAYPGAEAGTPNLFTIEGAALRIRPVDDAGLSLLYWQKIPPLADGINWLFAAHPDVYLFGALCEANIFLRDDATAAIWKGRRDEAFDEIERLSRQTGAPAAIRVAGPVI
jgi:hypothetical protein